MMKNPGFYFLLLFLCCAEITLQAQWTQLNNFPGIGRYRGISFTINGFGYHGCGNQIGGVSESSDMWKYDPVGDSWSQVANFPIGNQAASSFVINDHAYAGSGWSGGNSFANWYKYDPITNNWAAIASMLTNSIHDAGMFALNGKGYLLGGALPYSIAQSNTLFEYDPLLDAWTQKNNFPVAKRIASTFIVNGICYAGLGQSPGGVSAFDFYEYDPINDLWLTKAPFPDNSIYMGYYRNTFVLNNTPYLLVDNGFWYYEPVSDSWISLPNQPFAGSVDGTFVFNNNYAVVIRQSIQEVWKFSGSCTKPGVVSLGTDRSTILCPNDSVKIFIVNPTTPNLTYQWYSNNIPIAGANLSYCYATDNKKYKVKVASGPGSQCERISGLVQPTSESAPPIAVTAQGSTSICQGDSVLLTATVVSGYNYQWVRYGVNITGATSSQYYAKNGGTYKVKITNAGGCNAVSSGISVSIVCRLAGSEPVSEGITIYPNPASDNITISFDDLGREKPVLVEIKDISGKTIIRQIPDPFSKMHSIDITSFPPGNYPVCVTLDGGEAIEKQIIVNR